MRDRKEDRHRGLNFSSYLKALLLEPECPDILAKAAVVVIHSSSSFTLGSNPIEETYEFQTIILLIILLYSQKEF